jgi:hypothetical protein
MNYIIDPNELPASRPSCILERSMCYIINYIYNTIVDVACRQDTLTYTIIMNTNDMCTNTCVYVIHSTDHTITTMVFTHHQRTKKNLGHVFDGSGQVYHFLFAPVPTILYHVG